MVALTVLDSLVVKVEDAALAEKLMRDALSVLGVRPDRAYRLLLGTRIGVGRLIDRVEMSGRNDGVGRKDESLIIVVERGV